MEASLDLAEDKVIAQSYIIPEWTQDDFPSQESDRYGLKWFRNLIFNQNGLSWFSL
jgi:hypothetical protein